MPQVLFGTNGEAPCTTEIQHRGGDEDINAGNAFQLWTIETERSPERRLSSDGGARGPEKGGQG